MKLATYVIDFLVRNQIRDLFTVSGGGIAHLLDALGQNKEIRYYCNYHEQACAVAAEGHARVTGRIGACLVTVGPGAINGLSGIVGAWYDSIPLLVISGQVRSDLIADFDQVRQRGPQESNVIAMARPVTKYAVSVREPAKIRYELEQALHLATSGRPGPVWVEIPFDIQGATIDEKSLEGFTPPENKKLLRANALTHAVAQVLADLKSAARPLLVAGNGVHLSRSEALLLKLANRMGVPVVTPDASKDLLPENHPGYIGLFGTAGQRRGNFAIQNCDCFLGLGVGFILKKVGFNFKGFAPKAKKIIVDIDEAQLQHQLIKPDVALQADVAEFMGEMLLQLEAQTFSAPQKWLDACAKWKSRYPLVTPEDFNASTHVNSYAFVDKLSDLADASDVIVGGSGLDTCSVIQAFKVKPGQRSFTSINWGAMGWDLPLSVGACVASGRSRTICVTGDGSVQMNLQELMTIRFHNLPIKIFIFNNRGYASIRATQNALFDGRVVASDPASGVGNPNFQKLAEAYNLAYCRIENNSELAAGITRALSLEGPTICEVNIAPGQGIAPKASAFRREDGTLESRPLEDMSPFLPREEIWENMHQFDVNEGVTG